MTDKTPVGLFLSSLIIILGLYDTVNVQLNISIQSKRVFKESTVQGISVRIQVISFSKELTSFMLNQAVDLTIAE